MVFVRLRDFLSLHSTVEDVCNAKGLQQWPIGCICHCSQIQMWPYHVGIQSVHGCNKTLVPITEKFCNALLVLDTGRCKALYCWRCCAGTAAGLNSVLRPLPLVIVEGSGFSPVACIPMDKGQVQRRHLCWPEGFCRRRSDQRRAVILYKGRRGPLRSAAALSCRR